MIFRNETHEAQNYKQEMKGRQRVQKAYKDEERKKKKKKVYKRKNGYYL